ncbi:MAG: hypothetical protein JKY37_12170, partial [Nannocystaceae bacterium]|nr:hypothetical protein [Nannocystaceae bacterium]
GYEHGLRDVLLGMMAARDEPIAGGRHKVFGSRRLWIPPQTSTIASQLPKAVGMAFALRRAARLELLSDVSRDAIVAVSFGDASANHSTATGAINAASYIAHQDLAVPVLFVCEDNGLGISVETPVGWIENQYGTRGGLQYYQADGCDVISAYRVARQAVAWVRRERKPAFLHLATVRLLGHAGSDVALAYRSADKLRADMARDPLLAMARTLIAAGVLTPQAILARYREAGETVSRMADEASRCEGLASVAEIVAPLSPRRAPVVAQEVARKPEGGERREFWGRRTPEEEGPATLSVSINRCLGDLLVKYPELMVFGEDVAKKGGVYGVTRGLQKRAGVGRVFDTLLDEQTILGQAIGAAQAGFVAIPEIQYLAYLHNAEDQLRGEAASLQFFSCDQFRNPMVVRIAAYAYQKGFGGHFHNDNSVAVLRDIPGLVIASPSNGEDAAAMLRTCVAAAKVDGTVCAFLEPIALYTERDLHETGDGQYATVYDPDAPHVPLGSAKLYGDGGELLIVSFANGVRMSRRVAKRLAEQGVACTVMDLRWLSPMPTGDLYDAAKKAGRVLVVDETRKSGGVSEGIFAALIDSGFSGPMRRVVAVDTFIPLGPAADYVLVSESMIETAALEMVGASHTAGR